MQWDGQPRRVLVHPERNGLVYVLDRETGEVLSADPFHHVTAHRGVDMQTGRLIHVEEKRPSLRRVVRDICPTAPGAKDWSPSAFSRRTGLLYIPHNNMCTDWGLIEANYIAGTPYVGAEVLMKPGPGGHMGEFSAWEHRRAPRGLDDRRAVPRLGRRHRHRRQPGLLRQHGPRAAAAAGHRVAPGRRPRGETPIISARARSSTSG